MAAKDWKKRKYGSYWNSKKLRQIIIDKNTSNRWNVILGTSGGARTLLKEPFKTKSQALAFAKAYMRKN